MTEEAPTRRYKCGGFLFVGSRRYYTDTEEYLDWFGRCWTFTELAKDLHGEALPIGLIVNTEDYVPMIVTRNRDATYRLLPITDYYTTLNFANIPDMLAKEI